MNDSAAQMVFYTLGIGGFVGSLVAGLVFLLWTLWVGLFGKRSRERAVRGRKAGTVLLVVQIALALGILFSASLMVIDTSLNVIAPALTLIALAVLTLLTRSGRDEAGERRSSYRPSPHL